MKSTHNSPRQRVNKELKHNKKTAANLEPAFNSATNTIKTAVLGAVLLAVAGVVAFHRPEAPKQVVAESAENTAPKNLAPADTKQKPRALDVNSEGDEKINLIEKKFIEFAEAVNKKAEKYIKDPQMLAEVKIPLGVIRANSDNPHKNMRYHLNRINPNGHVVALKGVSPRHILYSIIDTGPADDVVGASYNDVEHCIRLRADFNPDDSVSMFLLFHELIHVKDDQVRREMAANGNNKYIDSLVHMATHPDDGFLNDEVRASAVDLEAANAYFDDGLRKLGNNPAG